MACFRDGAGDGVGDGDDVFVGGDVVEAQAGGTVEGSEGGAGGVAAGALFGRFAAEDNSECAFAGGAEKDREPEVGDFAQAGDDFEILFGRFSEAESGVEPKLLCRDAATQDTLNACAQIVHEISPKIFVIRGVEAIVHGDERRAACGSDLAERVGRACRQHTGADCTDIV